MNDEERALADGIAAGIGYKTTWREETLLDGAYFHTEIHVGQFIALEQLKHAAENTNALHEIVVAAFERVIKEES